VRELKGSGGGVLFELLLERPFCILEVNTTLAKGSTGGILLPDPEFTPLEVKIDEGGACGGIAEETYCLPPLLSKRLSTSAATWPEEG